MAYKRVKENGWEQPIRRGYRMMCCDCSLVHVMDFRIYRGRIQFRARLDTKTTSRARKSSGVNMQNVALNKHFYAIKGSRFVGCIHCKKKVLGQGLAKLMHLYKCKGESTGPQKPGSGE